MRLKIMGVMNITPNSFSDGGENSSPEKIQSKLISFSSLHAVDVGAESTAPMNTPITWEEEWERWEIFLPFLGQIKSSLSADTYHPETIFKLVKYWKDHHLSIPLLWNDVSGKFDDHVRDFLKEGQRFEYILCHNRAPTRALTGKHMEYVAPAEGLLFEELSDFFGPRKLPQVVFDPCLGFSKTYEENWHILEHFSKLQKILRHENWLLGFSRKSFLRQRFNLSLNDPKQKQELDQVHLMVLSPILQRAQGTLWIRTHRPDLMTNLFIHS
jgi:dihydropteroate synthase